MSKLQPAVPKDEKKINGFDRWDVRNAMDTLAKAECIKKDTKMMEAVGVLAKERLEEMAHVIAHVDHATSK